MQNKNTLHPSVATLVKRDIDKLVTDTSVLTGKRVLHALNGTEVECDENARYIRISDQKHGLQSIWRVSVVTEPNGATTTMVETGIENEFVGTYVVDDDKDALVLIHLGQQGVVLPLYDTNALYMETVNTEERLLNFHNRLKDCTPIDFSDQLLMNSEQAQAYLRGLGAVALEEGSH